MGVQYTHAKEGYRFKITYTGRKIKSIAAKYEEGSMLYKQYQHTAPKSWITQGYIEEVKKED